MCCLFVCKNGFCECKLQKSCAKLLKYIKRACVRINVLKHKNRVWYCGLLICFVFSNLRQI